MRREVAPASTAVLEQGSATILLVEDDASLRELLSRSLSRCGYSVVAPATPEEALRLAQDEIASLELLVTDAVMPGMSGPSLARQVTACWPDVRVLLISGYTDDAMLRLGLLDSNQTFMQKPFGPRAFLQKVREVLDRHGVAAGCP